MSRWISIRRPGGSKYAGVVSREIASIVLTYAYIHQTQVIAAAIRNAYLQAPTPENMYIICGFEFGAENVGKRSLIVRALYERKADGHEFCHHLKSCMGFLGFKSQGGDHDVWMRPDTQKGGTLV